MTLITETIQVPLNKIEMEDAIKIFENGCQIANIDGNASITEVESDVCHVDVVSTNPKALYIFGMAVGCLFYKKEPNPNW